MFKCREACKLLSEAQDRKLTLRERVLLNFHLAVRQIFLNPAHLFSDGPRIEKAV